MTIGSHGVRARAKKSRKREEHTAGEAVACGHTAAGGPHRSERRAALSIAFSPCLIRANRAFAFSIARMAARRPASGEENGAKITPGMMTAQRGEWYIGIREIENTARKGADHHEYMHTLRAYF